MSKFDIRYSEILNEAGGFLGGLGKVAGAVGNFTNNVASGVGSGINAAQNPFDATKKLIQGAAGLNKKAEERTQSSISVKNPVKKNELVMCNTSVYSIKDVPDPRDPTKQIPVWDLQQMTIQGQALTDSDKTNGSFKVRINPVNGKNLTFFVYTEISATRRGQPPKSTSVVVVGLEEGLIDPATGKPIIDPATGNPKYNILGAEYMVGPMQNVDQSLQNWYIIPKNQPKP